MATLHIICGFIAAGKTTFAKQLEEQSNAVRFSIDEWMISLYGQHMSREDFEDRMDRCKTLIWKISKRLLALEIDVILDFGFWKRAERSKYQVLANKENVDFKLYFLKADFDVLRHRLKFRNDNLPPGHFEITEEMFNTFLPLFQLPEDDERPQIVSQLQI